MPIFARTAIGIVLASTHIMVSAAATDFSGDWTIDLRTPEERRQKRDCGMAGFKLKQAGERIVGNHYFHTVGCSRSNEGGEGTVQGIVVGATAVLVVTSGRNGAIAFGKATRTGDRLYWETVGDILPGDPEGDSPLILGKGTLIQQNDVRRFRSDRRIE